MTHLDLFSGIGGFALTASWMGWQTVQFVEIEPFCQAVLKKNFPNTPIHGDIKTFDGTKLRGTIDILTGGFPCQPFSTAGKRKGKEDDRYLWPEMLRVIAEVRPKFIVGENVSGSWQLVDQICTDLEDIGYETEPTGIEAASIGAPHRRLRYWFIAFSKSIPRNGQFQEYKTDTQEVSNWRFNELESITDTSSNILQGCKNHGSTTKMWQEREKQSSRCIPPDWENFPTQSPICRGNDGIPNRVDRIKSLGNAIVPQVAFEIFKAIEKTI